MTKRLKMKDLESATGVGREAIRFYIREGLLPEPERAGRNVAWYDESFIERIALIKRLQSERFLPLGIIKAILRGDEVPPDAEVQTLVAIDKGLTIRGRKKQSRLPERVEGIAARTSIPVAEIHQLEGHGALQILHRDGDAWLEGPAIEVVEAWADMRGHGFTHVRGFETDVTQIYVQFVQWMAREEVRMFTERVTGKVQGEELTAMAEVGIEAAGRLLGALRETAIRRYIAEGNIPRDRETPEALRTTKKR